MVAKRFDYQLVKSVIVDRLVTCRRQIGSMLGANFDRLVTLIIFIFTKIIKFDAFFTLLGKMIGISLFCLALTLLSDSIFKFYKT